jgi:hypothetical protein
MNVAVDTNDPIDFVGYTMGLGLGGWGMGNVVERSVGSRGIVFRILVNALVLYSMYVLLPQSITSHAQKTFPGIVFCAAFFNTQRWNSKKMF